MQCVTKINCLKSIVYYILRFLVCNSEKIQGKFTSDSTFAVGVCKELNIAIVSMRLILGTR